MALQKQLIPISFGTGIDTKVDAKQQVQGKFRSAINTVFETFLLSKKRPGYDRIVLKDVNGSMVENLQVLTKFKNELNLLTNTDFFAYSTTRNVLIERGQVFNVSPTTDIVIADSFNHTQPDVAFVENFKVIAWQNESTGAILYSVIDYSDESQIVSNTEVAAAGTNPKVAVIQNFVYIVYSNAGTIYYKRFSILTPQTLGSAVTITSDLNIETPNYDVLSASDKVYVCFYDTTPELSILNIDASENISSITSYTEDASSFVDLQLDSLNRILITIGGETDIRFMITNLSLLAQLLPFTTIDTVTNPANGTSIMTGANTYDVYYEISADNTTNTSVYLKKNTVTYTGTVGAAIDLMRSVGLASKAIFANNESYFLTIFSSQTQSTYFLINNSGKIAAKINPNNSGGLLTNGSLPKISLLSENFYIVPTSVKSKLNTTDDEISAILGISTATLEFNNTSPYQVTQLGENSHIAGGILRAYDGKDVVEHGFHVYPENVNVAVSNFITSVTTATVEVLQVGNAGTREVQEWTFSSTPPGGSLFVMYYPYTQRKFNIQGFEFATADRLQQALNLTGSQGARDGTGFSRYIYQRPPMGIATSVTGTIGTSYTVTFIKPVTNIGEISVLKTYGTSNPLTISTTTQGIDPIQESQLIKFIAPPETGTWTITIGANTTAAMTFNESLADIKTEIEALPGINTVFVTGSYEEGIQVNFVDPAVPGGTMIVNSSLTHKDYGGKISDGSRGYTAIYTWTDNYGQIHRSAPSEIEDVEFVAGNSTQSARITVPTLRLTDKENVNIEIYRTEAAGTVFYKVTEITAPLLNDPTEDSVDFIDGVSDEDLIRREPLYTSGGVIENIAAPSCKVMTASSERIALAGIDRNPYTVLFSKIKSSLAPVEFTDFIEREIDPVGGPITALAFMADKYIIFTERAMFFIAGQGPNNLGQQDDFTSPEQISTDVGCINQQSVVVTPLGLMFKSAKGIFLLDQGLGLKYIGSDVEEFNGLEITSAKVLTEQNQVRFTTTEGTCLVYNYQFGLWSTFDNHPSIGAEIVDGTFFYLRSDEELFKQNNNKYSDGDVPVTQSIETGWLSFNAIQSFARVYKILILGDFKSAHKLRVSVAYDFKEAYTQTVLVEPEEFVSSATYGSESPYGSGTPYGGNGNLYQLRIDLAQQKCQSIRIKIEELQDTAGQGLTLSAMTIQAGLKVGTNKLPVANKFGTN